MAHFAVTDDGQPMPYAEARKIIGAQPMGKLGDLTTESPSMRETASPGEQRTIIVAVSPRRASARLGVCPDSGKRMGVPLGIVPSRAKGDMVAADGRTGQEMPKRNGA